jgi:hypothetical protein
MLLLSDFFIKPNANGDIIVWFVAKGKQKIPHILSDPTSAVGGRIFRISECRLKEEIASLHSQ